MMGAHRRKPRVDVEAALMGGLAAIGGLAALVGVLSATCPPFVRLVMEVVW